MDRSWRTMMKWTRSPSTYPEGEGVVRGDVGVPKGESHVVVPREESSTAATDERMASIDAQFCQ